MKNFTIPRLRSYLYLVVISVLVFSLPACSLFQSQQAPADEPAPSDPLPPQPDPPEPEPVQTEDPAEFVPCPPGDTLLTLQASHLFTTDTGLGDWVWQAGGLVGIAIAADGSVSGDSSAAFAGQQSGQFSDGRHSCSFTAPAWIESIVSGTCDTGVLTLEIIEDWQMGEYAWQCDGDSFAFNIPPIPPAVHTGIELILTRSGSSSAEIPWGSGDGYKSWRVVQDIPIVPLTQP